MPSDSTLDSAPEDAWAMLPGVEPQINTMVSVPGPAVRLSSMADAFPPLSGVDEPLGRSHVGLAQVLAADLADDRSVRRVLSQYARQGCDFERDRQIQGFSIGCIPDGREQRVTVPGPEDLVIPRLVPWAQQCETESVRYVVGRFDEQEQAALRVWAENHSMPWTKAPALVHQDEAQGEHNRRKLKRLAKDWHRHEINRRELP
ncbi:hypothetical protein ACFWAZ_28420 [Streptomyces collinus]|uniref:hypothetical protein n=1 Tax=Streptomyces collinus TaxID=42684 RepID=UPI00365C12ED